jgi:predicted phage terminase large subunit-like protein
MLVSEVAAVRALCQASFYDFIREFWSVNIAEPPVWNWHIPYLAATSQEAAERVFRGEPKKFDYIFNVPPGTTKSTLLSVMFPAWCWIRKPSMRFICGSYTMQLALDLARKSRNIIESDKYRACFPEVVLRQDQNTKGYFTNTQNGMRFSVGVGSSVIGMHAHCLLIDDPLDPTGASSEQELAIANSWCNETLPSRKVNKEISVTMLIMQRLHQNDPAGNWMAKDKGNIRRVVLPAELTPDIQPKHLARYYKDGMLDPVRLSHKVLKEARTDLMEYAYACQFLQTPIPPGGGMFRTEKILLTDRPPAKMSQVVRFWDKAGTAFGGAYTVGVKIGMARDVTTGLPTYYILDVVRGQWDTGEREEVIRRTAANDGRKVFIGIEQEPGSGGLESATATVRRLAGYRVKICKATGEKTVRAEEFSSQVNAGAVVMLRAPWNSAFIEEHKYFPHSTYKDQVDAASGAFLLVAAKRRRAGAL